MAMHGEAAAGGGLLAGRATWDIFHSPPAQPSWQCLPVRAVGDGRKWSGRFAFRNGVAYN
ncbi:hypothetical protein CA54_07080 [Symmachiella macrocystis]|uniref:Uncharacterized protein n=1 Tax=Symmachiella macrocystis TaxID=2527985 RepID=A0A5C6BKN3_9PLAN|nr:hypothetical protein CA54_07080 [Symmachiella macrocystis]